jgi:hypothetical protein
VSLVGCIAVRCVSDDDSSVEREGEQMAEKKLPATVHVYFDNVNSESYQTFLAYCDRLEHVPPQLNRGFS